jgi:hypothetical protein
MLQQQSRAKDSRQSVVQATQSTHGAIEECRSVEKVVLPHKARDIDKINALQDFGAFYNLNTFVEPLLTLLEIEWISK